MGKKKVVKHVARYAYTCVNVGSKWGIALCEENVSGYRPVLEYGPYVDSDHAKGIVDRLNERRLKISKSEATLIVSSSMFPKLDRKALREATAKAKASTDLKVGDVFVFTFGNHDDYTVITVAMVMRDFNIKRKSEMYERKCRKDHVTIQQTEFVSWLVRRGLISVEPMTREMFLGDVGDSDTVISPEARPLLVPS